MYCHCLHPLHSTHPSNLGAVGSHSAAPRDQLQFCGQWLGHDRSTPICKVKSAVSIVILTATVTYILYLNAVKCIELKEFKLNKGSINWLE